MVFHQQHWKRLVHLVLLANMKATRNEICIGGYIHSMGWNSLFTKWPCSWMFPSLLLSFITTAFVLDFICVFPKLWYSGVCAGVVAAFPKLSHIHIKISVALAFAHLRLQTMTMQYQLKFHSYCRMRSLMRCLGPGSVQWGRSMTGHRSSASIAAFWNHCKSLDEWKDHPALRDVTSLGRSMAKLREFWAFFVFHPTWIEKIWFEVFRTSCFMASQGMIPLCLHVDGAEFYSNSEYLCWSMASIFAEGHVFDTKFPLCVLPHQSMATDAVKQHVHTTVAKVLAWSLRVAATGVFPTKGAFDEPFKWA